MFAYTSALVERAMVELAHVKGDRKGVTALEYGLLAGLIAAVIIASVQALGVQVTAIFTAVTTALTPAA